MAEPGQSTRLIKAGKIAPGSRVDLAKSGVGVAVKAGAPKPDISSTEALKRTLLAAKSIGYSTGPSGVYVVGLFERLGLADQIKPKLKQTPTGVFVGSIVASGEVEIGFQQVSEMRSFPGVDFVGPLPADVQQTTIFASGIAAAANSRRPPRRGFKFLTAPAAAAGVQEARHGAGLIASAKAGRLRPLKPGGSARLSIAFSGEKPSRAGRRSGLS